MAIRIDAVSDYVIRSSGLPNLDPITVSLWAYVSVDRDAASDIIFFTDNSSYITIGTSDDGTTLRIITPAGSATGSSLSVATWYHLAFVHNGTSLTLYLNGVSNVTLTDSTTFTLAYFLLGSNTTANWLNGRIAAIKVWNAALTQAEIQQEIYTIRPNRFADLYGWWPAFPGATERLADYSGNGRTWTAGGTLTDEDPPPVSWGADNYWPNLIATIDLIIAELLSAGALDPLTLTQLHLLTTADLLSSGALDALTLTQLHILAIAELLSTGTLDTLTLTQLHILAIAELLSAGTLDTLTLTQIHSLTIAELLGTATLDTLTLTQTHLLAITDLLGTGTLDTLTLAQIHNLTVGELLSYARLDRIELLIFFLNLHTRTVSLTLAPDNVTLAQRDILSLADHGQSLSLRTRSATLTADDRTAILHPGDRT